MRCQLHHLLEDQARRRRDRPALTFADVTVDYATLSAAVRSLAAGLQGLAQRGDRVGIYLDKRMETVETIFAASAAGLVFVPVNPLLKAAQVGHILSDCEVRVLVTSRARWQQIEGEVAAMPALRHVVLVDETSVGQDAHGRVAMHTHQELAVKGGVPEAGPAVDLDIAAILYTSGSTGKPKGVVLSHRNLVVGAESVSSYLGNHAEDVILAALPLSFDAGLSQVTTAFSVGAHVVLMNYLVPGDVVKLCEKHRVTGLTCVPPLWLQLAALEWPAEASTLRYFANTGGRVPRHTVDRLREIFPSAQPYLMYGLTEAFRSTYLDPAEIDRRPDSIGKAIPNAEIMVVRPDGSLAAPGEEGELVHRGPLVALGYWNDPERTAQIFRPLPGVAPSWRQPELAVWSGDNVVADEDGYLYFVGRADEMIKTSGYRVSPTEVEEAAYATGLVGDAVAMGLEDTARGQRIVLVVTGNGTGPLDQGAVLAELRRTLPRFMVPSELREMDVLPRSPNGKFDRVLIRKEVS
ncbi:acyl-CoA ligase (AMP-forming), exosortase A system-associated [Nocardioides dilutus]